MKNLNILKKLLILIIIGLYSNSSSAQCTSKFKYSVVNLTAAFTDLSYTSSGTITDYYWDFGDGDTASAQSPSHTYSTTGTYVVTFAIYTTTGCTDTLRDTISIQSMTYVSSTAFQASTSLVSPGSSKQAIVGVKVITSATGAAINIDKLTFNTAGTNFASTNITNAKVWYTGNSSKFATTTQYGSTIASPTGQMDFNSSQSLLNNANYFWLTYDIQSGANTGDSVDAKVVSMKVAGTTYTPTVTTPNGSRIIGDYCTPSSYSNSSSLYYL